MKYEPNKFKLIPLNILTEPQSTGLYKVYKDFYWFITKDNEILLSEKYKTPQCNADIKVLEHMIKSYNFDLTIEKIPFIYLEKMDSYDY